MIKCPDCFGVGHLEGSWHQCMTCDGLGEIGEAHYNQLMQYRKEQVLRKEKEDGKE